MRGALGLSLALHALGWFLWSQAPVTRAVLMPEPPAPIAFEVVQIPTPSAEPEAKRQATTRVVKVPPKVSLPVPSVTAPPAHATDSPRGALLLPRQNVVRLPEPGEQPSNGQTVRNRPDELADPAAVLAHESERVRKRVDGWAQQTLARVRVENGVVSDYFHQLRHRLEQVTQEPPPFVEPFGLKSLPEHVDQAVDAWSTAAERYGKTGSAYQPLPGDRELHAVARSEAERGGHQAREFATKSEAAARLRDFGDGRMGEELIAIVEVRQNFKGALAALSLISPSSSVRFDAWVMKQAPQALDGKVAPPDGGVGIHATGMRSVWAFKGKVTYKRNLKEAKLLEDAWYLALVAAPSLLTGNFDEVTGTVEYVDLRYPRYECRVHLLEVY